MREKQRELLIKLRSALIGEKNTLPYCIYSDATIEHLLDAQPKTIEELVKVKGFPEGGKRVTGFGEAIISIFNGKDVEKFELGKDNKGEVCINTKIKPIKVF